MKKRGILCSALYFYEKIKIIFIDTKKMWYIIFSCKFRNMHIGTEDFELMNKKRERILHIVKAVLPWMIFPCASFYLMETFHHNPFVNINTNAQILNIIIFEAIALLLWMITGSRKWAFRVESMVALIIGLADYYVIEFRGTPILPWDIYSIKTAASVGGDYSYTLGKEAVFSLLAFVVLIALESIGKDYKLERSVWKVRLAGVFVALAVLGEEYQLMKSPAFIADMRIYDKLFTPYVMIKRDGIALAFMLELQYMEVEKPKDYNSSEAEDTYEALSDDIVVSEEKRPNVIVVMNEAFSDPAVLGAFEASEDYMPVLHGLQEGAENTITGLMNVSVVGGNTANTEFEFLTGSSMAFLPDGSVPYQQYIDEPMDSMASHLKDMGYKTIAMHPYNASGWERNIAYPYIGFDTFYSLKNFRNVTKVRDYVDDDSCVDRIIQEFEKSKEPCFIFNVTMQNHSPYTAEYDNFTPDITVKGSDSFQLSNYLSLMKLSDASLGRLIEYFSRVDEETVLVFFGDHQPTDSVVRDVWKLNGVDPYELTEEQQCLRYQVPFVVWANYDIEEQTDVMTSSCFLGAQVFDWCGIPKSGYQNYLLELNEEYSAITARTAMDKKGNFVEIEDIKGALLEYNMLQYYRLFG